MCGSAQDRHSIPCSRFRSPISSWRRRSSTMSISEALLRAHPDVNGIACVSATGGPTLAQVIQSAGKPAIMAEKESGPVT
jgi:hypothetical protein